MSVMTTEAVNVNCYEVISRDFHEKVILDKTPSIVLDKTYEADSTSTSTTNSPIISSTVLDSPPSICVCNELLDSRLNCKECHQTSLKPILSEYTQAETQLIALKLKRDALLARYEKLKQEASTVEATILEKEQCIQTTSTNTESLRHDLLILETKCKDETYQVEDIQRSKENVKKEIEELAQRLFEEANAMISVEKAEQQLLSQKNEELESTLKTTKSQLAVVEDQLKVIRYKMDEQLTQQRQRQRRQSFSEKNSNTTTIESGNTLDILIRTQLETSLMHGIDNGLQLDVLEDDSALMDFNDFVQLAQKTQLRKLHSLKYMKYCIRDDIEPCLRFGPNPRISSRKIMDAILVKSCFVERCPEGFLMGEEARQMKEEAAATLWERFTTSSVFFGCQACGRKLYDSKERVNTLKYRFRISYFDEWACVDRYCRDRLLAVIEYYNFIRHLRAGSYKHRSLHELYQESTRLRLQMFLARMGTLPTILQSCNVNPEKIATAFKGEDVSNSNTMVSDSNLSAERISSSTESSITISTINSARTSMSFA